jgi:transcriptional regulator with XRE-family HTH domain
MTDPITSAWQAQRDAMGAFIRSQRELANMSLRELSRATQVSNAYLSQIERGLHDPTLKVLTQIAEALHLSVEDLLRESTGEEGSDGDQPGSVQPGTAESRAGDSGAEESGTMRPPGVEAAVLADPTLTPGEKDALLTVYRSYLATHAERDA